MHHCLCAAPDCPTCGPAQGWHVHSRRCLDADGQVDCGRRAYADEARCCLGCGAPSDTEYCATCQRCIEEDEA